VISPDARHKPSQLRADEVHLWWERLDTATFADTLRGWLSDDERRRSERFRRAQDACAFVLRRAFLRALLARYAGCPPDELAFVQGALGKPTLAPPHASISFNLSRSREWVLVAVTLGHAVGVDVEHADPRLEDAEELSLLARKVLTEAEQRQFSAFAPRERVAAFLRGWTRKEALLKALGTGLAREPRLVHVGLESRGPLEQRVIGGDVFLAGARMLDLSAPSGWTACLVAEGSGEVVVCARPGGGR
jgi:4'-phosphopantetheinyl transferase